MEKKKIFSKLNINNYSQELEEILEKKEFSLDVKNLLLSMLYKIENAYKDYFVVKREVLSKSVLMSYLIKIINEKCYDIQFISFESDKKPKIMKEEGKILCYPNELSLLSGIWKIGETEVEFVSEYELQKIFIQKMIDIGSVASQVEVLRDFNGWSWNNSVKEIENLKYNILYQSLLLINGKEFIYCNMEGFSKNSKLLQTNEKMYLDFIEILFNVAMNINIKENANLANEILKIKQQKKERFNLLKDNKKFVEQISKEKKEYLEGIDKIDKIINNEKLLKDEYIKRNKNLSNNEKIFSISHLVKKLDFERKEFLEKIQKCNKVLQPKEFIKEKDKLERELKFLDTEKSIFDCCKQCLKCAKSKIEILEEKADIINWIYKIRYYANIPIDEEKCLKDLKELEKEFKEVIMILTKKAQIYKIWDVFTEDEELSYYVIREIFYSKIIDLENINILCKYVDKILYLEYYDLDVLENKKEIKLDNVRIKKKIKLFI